MSRKSHSGRRKKGSGRTRVRRSVVQRMRGDLRQRAYPEAFRIEQGPLPPDLPASAEAPGHAAPAKPPGPAALDDRTRDLLGLVANVATGLWRARKRMLPDGQAEPPDELRGAYRHVEATWDALISAKVEVRDHTGERYVPGMALKVIAFQPTRGVALEVIDETIKPSVYYGNLLIQRGEVIVATPDQEPSAAADDEGAGPAEDSAAGDATDAPAGSEAAEPPTDDAGRKTDADNDAETPERDS